MRVNESVALSNSKTLLVPYCVHHVTQYHEWMKDPDIQAATASEPLSLDDEYTMQRSWRDDSDKLTFVICQPISEGHAQTSIEAGRFDGSSQMIGDVNMFMSMSEHDDGEYEIGGELEIMIAERNQQHQGIGRAALLTFLRYILEHEDEVVAEFLQGAADLPQSRNMAVSFYTAKIGGDNSRSIALFEGLGFRKTSGEPSYFGEFELRHGSLTLEALKGLMMKHSASKYKEITYKQ